MDEMSLMPFILIPMLIFVFLNPIKKIIRKLKKAKNVHFIKSRQNQINDPEFLNVYNEIVSGYKNPYLRREPKMLILDAIIATVDLLISIITFWFLLTTTHLLFFSLIISFIILFVIYNILIKIFPMANGRKEIIENLTNGNKYEFHIIEKLGQIFSPSFSEIALNPLESDKISSTYRISNLAKKHDIFELHSSFSFYLDYYQNVKVNIYNIVLKEIYKDEYGTRRSIEETFEGAFCEITLDFSINYPIKIIKNNNFKSDSYNIRNKNIIMDNSLFEKYFDVFCENNMETMKLLTSDFMDNICTLYNSYNIPFEISAKHNKVFLVFDENIYNFKNPLKKPKLAETYYEYCKIGYIMNVCNLFYTKLKELSENQTE